MSINAYVGLPGAGKTYGVVANVILPALRDGRRVVTNVPLHEEEVRKVVATGELVKLDLERIATEPESIDSYCTAGAVVVLDEVWRLWPAGMKSHQVPESFRSLLAEHRHRVDASGRAMQIVLLAQDLAQISAWARVLIETTFVHTQLSHIGANRKYRVASYRGAVDTMGANKNLLIRDMFGTYKREVYDLYQSHTMRETAGAGADELSIDRRATVWKRPIVWVGLAFVALAPIFAIAKLLDLVSPDEPALSVASEASPESPAKLPAAVVPTMGSRFSRRPVETWRVGGWVRSVERERYGFAAIVGGRVPIIVPWSECFQPGDGLTHCAFQGLDVTELGVNIP